jgi:hypothetical protein
MFTFLKSAQVLNFYTTNNTYFKKKTLSEGPFFHVFFSKTSLLIHLMRNCLSWISFPHPKLLATKNFLKESLKFTDVTLERIPNQICHSSPPPTTNHIRTDFVFYVLCLSTPLSLEERSRWSRSRDASERRRRQLWWRRVSMPVAGLSSGGGGGTEGGRQPPHHVHNKPRGLHTALFFNSADRSLALQVSSNNNYCTEVFLSNI